MGTCWDNSKWVIFLVTKDRKLLRRKENKQLVCLMNAGVRPGGLNPICCTNTWKMFGLSSMLYGCEVWSRLTVTEIELLNMQSWHVCSQEATGSCANIIISRSFGYSRDVVNSWLHRQKETFIPWITMSRFADSIT